MKDCSSIVVFLVIMSLGVQLAFCSNKDVAVSEKPPYANVEICGSLRHNQTTVLQIAEELDKVCNQINSIACGENIASFFGEENKEEVIDNINKLFCKTNTRISNCFFDGYCTKTRTPTPSASRIPSPSRLRPRDVDDQAMMIQRDLNEGGEEADAELYYNGFAYLYGEPKGYDYPYYGGFFTDYFDYWYDYYYYYFYDFFNFFDYYNNYFFDYYDYYQYNPDYFFDFVYGDNTIGNRTIPEQFPRVNNTKSGDTIQFCPRDSGSFNYPDNLFIMLELYQQMAKLNGDGICEPSVNASASSLCETLSDKSRITKDCVSYIYYMYYAGFTCDSALLPYCSDTNSSIYVYDYTSSFVGIKDETSLVSLASTFCISLLLILCTFFTVL